MQRSGMSCSSAYSSITSVSNVLDCFTQGSALPHLLDDSAAALSPPMLRQLGVVTGTTYVCACDVRLLVQRPGMCPSPPALSLSHDQNECFLRCQGAGTVDALEDGCNKIHCVASKSERQDQAATSPATEVRSRGKRHPCT